MAPRIDCDRWGNAGVESVMILSASPASYKRDPWGQAEPRGLPGARLPLTVTQRNLRRHHRDSVSPNRRDLS
jgi:hypothetical protein